MKRFLSIFLAILFVFSFSANTFALTEKEAAAEELEKYGLVERNALGALTVEGPVTRAMVVKMLVTLLGEVPEKTATPFSDVPKDHFASGYISFAAECGIINGMGDGTFSPETAVTNQQAVKMLVCALGYRELAESRGGYPHGYVMAAMNLGILPSKTVTTEETDRGDLLIMLKSALDVPLMVMEADGEAVVYKVMDGKNGEKLVTFRTKLQQEN